MSEGLSVRFNRLSWRQRLLILGSASFVLAGCGDTASDEGEDRSADPNAPITASQDAARDTTVTDQETAVQEPTEAQPASLGLDLPEFTQEEIEELTGLSSVEEAIKLIEGLPREVVYVKAVDGARHINGRPLVEAAQGDERLLRALDVDIATLSEAFVTTRSVLVETQGLEKELKRDSETFGYDPRYGSPYHHRQAMKAQLILQAATLKNIAAGDITLEEDIEGCPDSFDDVLVTIEVEPGVKERLDKRFPAISLAYVVTEQALCDIDPGQKRDYLFMNGIEELNAYVMYEWELLSTSRDDNPAVQRFADAVLQANRY
jgi:hypothetical protein